MANLRQVSVFVLIVGVILLTTWSPVWAQSEETAAAEPKTLSLGVGLKASIKLPPGFVEIPSSEPGVMKWRKDEGEILLVVGKLFADSPDKVYTALLDAARKNSKIAEVREVSMNCGKAFLYKEKSSEEQTRMRIWRLVVILDGKMIHLDCAAPKEALEEFSPEFEEVLQSFQIISSP